MRRPKGFSSYRKKPIIVFAKQMLTSFTTKTMEGTLTGKRFDYLVIGVQGERYPCDRKIFEQTYEKVEE